MKWNYFFFQLIMSDILLTVRRLFHKQGFTYDYVFDWKMLKSGGSGPESDENLAKHQRQNQRQELICALFEFLNPGSRGTIASSDLKQPESDGNDAKGTIHILRKQKP